MTNDELWARIAELEAENTILVQTLDTVNQRLGRIADQIDATGDKVIGLSRHLQHRRAADHEAIEAVTDRLVTALFTNGAGEEADRLVLTVDAPHRVIGGWGRHSIRDRILQILG